MTVISMKQLLEAGCHFGHPTRKWNPKMKKYIFTARNDIHILNLEDTSKQIDEAYVFIKEKVLAGANVLYVGTKKGEIVKQEAERANMFYVSSRWLGGTLTNFSTIRKRIDRMNKLNQMETLGDFELLPKKEVIKLKAERDKLAANLSGIKDMTSIPGLMIIVDPSTEHIAVQEAKRLGIPTVGIVDTNSNPDDVDVCIPANDDASGSVKLILSALTDAYDNMNTKNYYTGVVFLCMAQFYYDMTIPEINFIFEHTGDYLAKHEEAMFGACMDVLEVKGDVAWTFYTSKTTQATLQNYVKKHSDKCSQQRGK